MSSDLQALTTPARVSSDTFRWSVPSDWLQGRGVFGGLVTATTIRAAEAYLDDVTKPLRSLTAHLCGPTTPGEALLRLTTLRTGNNIATVVVELSQENEVRSHAVLLFGSARSRDCDGVASEAPEMPSWRTLEPAPVGPPLGPMFTQHMEFRLVEGVPYSGDTHQRASGWIRPKAPGAARDAAYVSALADAWWPIALHAMETPRPVGTVTYTLELASDCDGLDPEAPCFHVARQVAGRDGYLFEFRELRGEDGRLLALNQQTIALIR